MKCIVELDDGIWMTRSGATKNRRLAFLCCHEADADVRLLHRRRKARNLSAWPRASFHPLPAGADRVERSSVSTLVSKTRAKAPMTAKTPGSALIPAAPAALLNVDRGRPFQRYDPDTGERVHLDGRPMRRRR